MKKIPSKITVLVSYSVHKQRLRDCGSLSENFL